MAGAGIKRMRQALPKGRRLRERAAGSFFRASTRVVGLRAELIPMHMRQQLRLIGVDDAQLHRVLRNIRSLADWPYAWEAEGDRYAALGDWHQAVSLYYLAQRPLITDSPLKRRLYRLVLGAYERAGYSPSLEHLRVTSRQGETIAGYLQVPKSRDGGPVPLVVMAPGVTATKEELHVLSAPMTARGWAVARVDSPGYGETTGSLRDGAQFNVADVVAFLRNDARIDPERVHLFGMSMGAHTMLNAATKCDPASVMLIAPAFETHTFLADLPTSNLQAIGHMMGTDKWEEMLELARVFGMGGRAGSITCPVRMFHGGRDQTIPVEQAWMLVEELGGPVALTVFERDHHNCLEHFDEMLVQMLEWLDDPMPAIEQFERERAQRATHAPAHVGILDRVTSLLPGHHAGDAEPSAEPGLA